MSVRCERGAAAELIVCADLIRKGYSVYRAVSPTTPFDIVAYMGGALTKIEVRSSQERRDGTMLMPTKETDDCDMYAFVVGTRIEYMTAEDIAAVRAEPGRGRQWKLKEADKT